MSCHDVLVVTRHMARCLHRYDVKYRSGKTSLCVKEILKYVKEIPKFFLKNPKK